MSLAILDAFLAIDWSDIGLATVETLTMVGGSLFFTVLLGLPLGIVLFLTGLFVTLNAVFTAITLWLGPEFYGYGIAAALTITIMLGFRFLDRVLESLEYKTFMLQ